MVPTPSLTELLPQKEPAILLDEILDSSADSLRTRASIGPTHPYLVGDRVSSSIALEWMAQTIALHRALSGSVSKAPSWGYVAGARRLEVGEDYQLGDALTITVWPEGQMGHLFLYRAEVRDQHDQPRANGSLSVYAAEATEEA